MKNQELQAKLMELAFASLGEISSPAERARVSLQMALDMNGEQVATSEPIIKEVRVEVPIEVPVEVPVEDTARIEALEKELASYKAKCREMNKSLQAKDSDAIYENENLRAENDRLKHDLHAAQTTIAELKEEIESLELHTEFLNDRIEVFEKNRGIKPVVEEKPVVVEEPKTKTMNMTGFDMGGNKPVGNPVKREVKPMAGLNLSPTKTEPTKIEQPYTNINLGVSYEGGFFSYFYDMTSGKDVLIEQESEVFEVQLTERQANEQAAIRALEKALELGRTKVRVKTTYDLYNNKASVVEFAKSKNIDVFFESRKEQENDKYAMIAVLQVQGLLDTQSAQEEEVVPF